MKRRDFLKGVGGVIGGGVILGGLSIADTTEVLDDFVLDEEAVLEAFRELKSRPLSPMFFCQGSDEPHFTEPQGADYALMLPGLRVTITKKPKHRYFRVKCTDSEFTGEFSIAAGTDRMMSYGGFASLYLFMTTEDVLDFGEDRSYWPNPPESSKKRLSEVVA